MGETPAATGGAAEVADEGKVLNIYCWNEEFKSRMTDHYPGYKKVSDTEGKIGDVTVKWTITPSDDNAYQNALDEALKKQDSAAADDKIDLFLVEADYALKYVDTDYTMPVKDLGITDVSITPYMEEAAQADRVLVMSQGNVVMEGTPKEVFSQTEKVRSLRLDVPQAAELRDELAKAGIPMPEGIINTGECAQALYELLK